jgi:L-fuconolactonase
VGQRAGLRFDALVKPRHLKNLAKLISSWPDLKVVVDHGAKPLIEAGQREPWASDMRRLARESKALCKLSGLVTEAGRHWNEAALKPYVEVLLESFGPLRLMWGSDWPVVNEAGGYQRWYSAAKALTADLSASEREGLFGETALSFYGAAR